ncbi:MAG: acyl-CoA dehydrogenase family protein [Polymorphobacter sp.]|uniref:acyl-CoA dehydrogenase family protein n=1 Tax=Polymorphobacter sp. TaxID=1909290 RepID=UPI003A88D32D
MSFQTFTDEPAHVQQLRDTVERFIAAHAPRDARQQWDRDSRWPRDVYAELNKLGLTALTVPEEYGGAGQDIVAAIAVIEELSRAGPCLAAPYIHTAFYGGMNLSENGSPQQKATFLPALARGELFFAYGLSEPDVGGDLASVATRARIEGDDVVITGAKRWCTGADWCHQIYTLVRSGPAEDRYKNLSFILIPTDAPGVSMQPIHHANLRYTASMDVYFDEVRLPKTAIVGGEGNWNQGWKLLAGRALDVEKLEISAVALGIARAALDEAWDYAQNRKQFGKTISQHQSVRHKLVTARTKLQAARHMLYHAAWLANEGRRCSIETSMAKLFIADTGVEIALTCQQVLGAYGLSDAFETERHVRDLLGMPIVGGSSDMQRNNLASLMKL